MRRLKNSFLVYLLQMTFIYTYTYICICLILSQSASFPNRRTIFPILAFKSSFISLYVIIQEQTKRPLISRIT